MKRIATAALSLLLMGALAGPAMAQSDVGDPFGDIYLSGAPNSYMPIMDANQIQLFQSFEFYLVADIDFADIGDASQNFSNGITAWEGSFTAPSQLIITNAALTPSNAQDFGNSNTDFIVGVGINGIIADSTPLPLVTFNALVSAAIPAPGFEMVIGEASIPTIPGTPVWQEILNVNGCTNRVTGAAEKCLYPFATIGSLTISTDVATEDASWGTLKSGYDR